MQQRPSNFAYLLLVLMTIFSMGGPFLIGWVLKGGEKDGWPPDRAIEWVTFLGVTGAVIAILTTILVYGITLKRKIARHLAATKAAQSALAAESGGGS